MISTSLLSKTSPFKIENPECGVITALDYHHFLGFQMLYFSIKNKVNLTVYDMGMIDEQKAWCESEKISVVPFREAIPNTMKSIPETIYYWQSWLKPFFIQHSPYRYTLWIDTDCIVVGDLTSVFESIIKKGLMVTRDEMLPSLGFGNLGRNDESLYNRYLVNRRWKSPDDYCNAGVAGYDKVVHEFLLIRYGRMVENALLCTQTPATKNLIGWYDEGCLNWALQSIGLNEDIIEPTNEWNRLTVCYTLDNKLSKSVYWTHYVTKFKRQLIVDDPQSFVDHIPSGDDIILHYRTPQKYWFYWKGVTCLS